MSGKEEWVLILLRSQHNCVERSVRPVFPDYLSVLCDHVPGYSSFISMANDPPKFLTKIVYYPVIKKPITEYSTVQEVLRYSEEASSKVEESIFINKFDLGVCVKAYPLVWNNQENYKNHIIMIGTFYLIMAYFKMIGKRWFDLVLVIFFWKKV